MRVEKKTKAFAYRIYSHFTQQCTTYLTTYFFWNDWKLSWKEENRKYVGSTTKYVLFYCNFFSFSIITISITKKCTFRLIIFFINWIVAAETIQGRKLIKGGNYWFLRGFCRGNYSREETIQGRKLFAEIRYVLKLNWLYLLISSLML